MSIRVHHSQLTSPNRVVWQLSVTLVHRAKPAVLFRANWLTTTLTGGLGGGGMFLREFFSTQTRTFLIYVRDKAKSQLHLSPASRLH